MKAYTSPEQAAMAVSMLTQLITLIKAHQIKFPEGTPKSAPREEPKKSNGSQSNSKKPQSKKNSSPSNPPSNRSRMDWHAITGIESIKYLNLGAKAGATFTQRSEFKKGLRLRVSKEQPNPFDPETYPWQVSQKVSAPVGFKFGSNKENGLISSKPLIWAEYPLNANKPASDHIVMAIFDVMDWESNQWVPRVIQFDQLNSLHNHILNYVMPPGNEDAHQLDLSDADDDAKKFFKILWPHYPRPSGSKYKRLEGVSFYEQIFLVSFCELARSFSVVDLDLFARV